MRLVGLGFAGLSALVMTVTSVEAAGLSAADSALYAAAFRAADLGRWDEARALADSTTDHTLRDVIVWRHMRVAPPEGPSLDARLIFLERHPDWPLTGSIRRLIEDGLLVTPRSPAETISILTRYPPISPSGKRALARAYLAQGDGAKVPPLIRDVWVNGTFAATDEPEILQAFAAYLRPEDHWRRADRLVWDGEYDAARRMIPRLDKGQGALIQARVILATGKGNAEKALAAVPATLRTDPGLIFERVRWRRQAGLDAEAIELLLSHRSGEGHDEEWWNERGILIRDMLDQGHISTAYKLAAGHERDKGTAFAEGEWLAGWIALRFLEDPKTALSHFEKLYEGVTSPISLSRAAYWAGRAAEALRQTERAHAWYHKATGNPGTFYGQLAASRLKVSLSELVPAEDPLPSPEETRALNSDRMMRVVSQMIELGRTEELLSFLFAMTGNHPGPGARAAIAKLALRAGQTEMAVRTARRAAQDATLLLEAGYPLPPRLAEAVIQQARTQGLLPAAAFGIIRQESNFDADARSRAGALGLMQLLPSTARAMAQREGVIFDDASLTRDPTFNTRLGTRYLADLVTRFDGSLVLAAAAYNAGPSRPLQWMNSNGDPRLMKTEEIVDWIERIPFKETRNYVQRVFEGTVMYRMRLGDVLPATAPEGMLRRLP
ncbi:lytic transglycosylase domain-containing protein [Pararhodospirillum photometricum]|uniref:lytic transglycosylase domain-containing protein n=1 Tax=Pararhodospirillum photometricum TaxID=1084 RepID=UPI00059ED959|nr:lytic transglycosylase domain-containing protein [Pararhodospirillum photometricum]